MRDIPELIEGDVIALAAAMETDVRYRLGDAIEGARCRRGISIRDLATRMEASPSTVQRLIHNDRYEHAPSLRTICRVAVALGMRVKVSLEEEGN